MDRDLVDRFAFATGVVGAIGAVGLLIAAVTVSESYRRGVQLFSLDGEKSLLPVGGAGVSPLRSPDTGGRVQSLVEFGHRVTAR